MLPVSSSIPPSPTLKFDVQAPKEVTSPYYSCNWTAVNRLRRIGHTGYPVDTADILQARIEMIETIESLAQHQLVILRRLRASPLTEFELAQEVSSHSGYSAEQCADRMADWLETLRREGLVWAGALLNADGQQIMAAALTKHGRELVH